MSLVFQIETVEKVWNEVLVLANQHWASTKSYRRHEPFSPSFERYNQCNQSGFFQLFTARDGQTLAGYFGLYLSTSMHSQLLTVTEDTMFLKPEYRGGRNALRFLRHIIEACRNWKVHEIMFSCEIDNETGIKDILKYLDFRPVVVQHSLVLTYSTRADSAHDSSVEVSDVRTVTSPGT